MKYEEIKRKYGLMPHPVEKIWYSVTFDENSGGSIYCLMGPGEFSCIHRIKVNEMWHFYEGSPLELIQFLNNGEIKKTTLGEGEARQHMIFAGCWMAARPQFKDSYSFLSCDVWGKFLASDVEYPTYEELSNLFPNNEFILKSFIL